MSNYFDDALLSYICPSHKKPLRSAGDKLECPAGDNFPIIGQIPRFVELANYADKFGFQWNRFPKTQLDSYTKTTISEDRLMRCLGKDIAAKLQDSSVLECGCGAGRFTEPLLKHGANVTSIDLSNAVDANIKNCPLSEKHKIAQADIYRLPFAEGSFDVVLCLGVVQHTPDSEKTIAELFKMVRPGGWLVIDHYRHSWSHYTKLAMIFRFFLKRLRPEQAYIAVRTITNMFLPLHKAARNFYPLQALISRVSPVTVYYHALPQLSDAHQAEWAFLDTHDSLTDHFKRMRSVASIRRTLERIGATNIQAWKGGNGVEARAQRPALA